MQSLPFITSIGSEKSAQFLPRRTGQTLIITLTQIFHAGQKTNAVVNIKGAKSIKTKKQPPKTKKKIGGGGGGEWGVGWEGRLKVAGDEISALYTHRGKRTLTISCQRLKS